MTEEHVKGVQLEGEELQNMRKLVSAAQDNLRQIAKLTQAKLHQRADTTRKHGRPVVARFYFDNIRVVIDDESGCSVYEDPPGICRGCRSGE